jgi:hypothetical protein
MVLVDNIGFDTGSFSWQEFEVVAGQVPAFLTGSEGSPNDKIPVLFLDWEGSWNHYGVNPTHSGDCPDHPGWSTTELHFNPLCKYFFLICPLDGKIYRYLNNLGNLDDLKVVVSGKKTGLDQDEDFPWYVSY